MRVPYSWLKEYIDISISPEELAERLTMIGIAVENIERVSPDEVVLELELTPNRSDCLSLINVARETAAVTDSQIRLPELNLVESNERIEVLAGVKIEAPELCGRYLARVIKDIQIEPSPSWMQKRLLAAGIRPINNIVDVTNYVMLETGQPLHAFDYDTLAGHQIIVRKAQPGERFTTLDQVERELTEDMLVIADADKAVALAGIMGGLETEVTDKTRNILLESAHFNPVSIRRTSQAVGLRTESSIRFEKGANIEGVAWAADRAAQLMVELGKGKHAAGVIDVYLTPWKSRSISLRISRINSLLGTELNLSEVLDLLSRLALKVTVKEQDSLLVDVPAYRGDLELEVDLIEEVARLYGYDRIPTTLPCGTTTQGRKTRLQNAEDKVKSILTGCGLTEVITFSMMSPRAFDRIKLPENDALRKVVVIANPLNEEQSVMRTTLIPNLLETASRNYSRRNTDLAIFEQGRVFYPKVSDVINTQLPEEKLVVAGLTMGNYRPGWNSSSEEMDFFFLKGVVEELLEKLGVINYSFRASSLGPTYHPGRSAEICCAGEEIGIIAEIHPDVLEEYGLSQRAWVFQLDLDKVFSYMIPVKSYTSVTRFPSVQRDLAVVVSDDFPAALVEAKIKEVGKPLLASVSLFDVYRGKPIAKGYRSLAYSLVYQAGDRTLTDEEVNDNHEKVRKALEKDLRLKLR